MSTRRNSDLVEGNPMCGECGITIRIDNNVSLLACNLCKRSFHFTCTRLSKAVFKELNSQDSPILFFCTVCKGTARTMVTSLGDLTKSLGDLTKKHNDLEARLAVLEVKVDAGAGGGQAVIPQDKVIGAQAALNGYGSGSQNALSMVDIAVNEVQDQKRRANNLMIFGLDEPDTEDSVGDKLTIHNVLDAVEIKHESMASFQRLGKRSAEKPRAVKLCMVSYDEKQKALSKAKSLKSNDNFNEVYLKPDLTVLQLQKQKALVNALKAANAEKKVMIIRRGRLVPLSEDHLDVAALGAQSAQSD